MNLPNILTVARVVVIFIFLFLASTFAGTQVQETSDVYFSIRLVAYLLAVVAAFTDLLDGYLARKWHQVTQFGALMDPLADKIFVTAVMLVAVEFRIMPAWVAALVIMREFMVTGLRMIAVQQGVIISADRWGKLKTVSQMVMLAIAGASWVSGATPNWHFDLWTKGTIGYWIWIGYLTAVVFVTVGSGTGYFIRYRFLFLPGKQH